MSCLANSAVHEKLDEIVQKMSGDLRAEFAETDPDLKVNVTIDKKNKLSENVLDHRSFRHVMTLLNTTPNGVMSYSRSVEGLVETSSNLGIMSIEKKTGEFVFLVRSSVESSKRSLVYNIKHRHKIVKESFWVVGIEFCEGTECLDLHDGHDIL